MSEVKCELAKMVCKLLSTPAFESLEQHSSSCGVTKPNEKKSKLLSWVASETFAVLINICPGFETHFHFHKITKLLLDISDNEVQFINARIQFSRCLLKYDQSYKEWVAELRSILKRCKFQSPNEDCKCSLINDNIRDAIYRRTLHKNIQSAFLQQTYQTLDQVVLIAESMVLISKTMQAIDRSDEACSINRLSKWKNDERIAF
ncbi:hypothetical protein RF11_14478 [Thelohanellus kitauei]|uniref:Uncharacterized protein n=1 Tax=Thelohanellus kitauei TaxID=669202 RepID=A0A0C2N5T1_THEKT|nr:hypothetical protein RF11_14478 [Thelohanellus kitauei]